MSLLNKSRVRVLLPHPLDGNIYIRELGQAYRAVGAELIYGVDNLFEHTVPADVLHIHWPEAFYRWMGTGSISERVQHFIDTIDAYKRDGAKVVWTIHNLTPHDHVNDPIDADVYQKVLDRADLLIHHCTQSSALLAAAYRVPASASELFIPHGHYLGYPHGVTRERARGLLSIPEDAFVYLQFGAVRSYKGLDTLLAAYGNVSHPKKWLLVAGNYQQPSGKGAWRDKLRMTWVKRALSRATLHLQSIPAGDIQNYFAAADCLVLTHSRGLNSGVAVLGMTFGKLVIAPRLGCIEWVVNAGKNLAFENNSMNSLVDAMNQAPRIDMDEVRQVNSTVAASWSWDGMAHAILRHPAIIQSTTEFNT